MSSFLIPPAYADFDKSIRTLFDGYGYGAAKLKTDLPIRSSKGALQLKTNVSSKTECRKLQGNVEVIASGGNYKLSEKVDADGMLQGSVTVEDMPAKGVKATLEHVYNPETRHKSTALRTVYKRPHMNTTFDMESDFLGQVFRSSLAFSYPCGGMIGGELMYESTLRRVTNVSVGFAYCANDFTASCAWQGLVDFLFSVHHKVSPKLQVGAQFTSSPHRSNTNMVLGSRYQLDDSSFLKTKFSSQGTLGLAYTHRLTQSGPALNVTLSALVDTRRLNQPNHKLGLSLEVS